MSGFDRMEKAFEKPGHSDCGYNSEYPSGKHWNGRLPEDQHLQVLPARPQRRANDEFGSALQCLVLQDAIDADRCQ